MNQKLTIDASDDNTPVWLHPGGLGATFQRCSYNVAFDGISGTADGVLKVYVTNDPVLSNTKKTLLETISINSVSNITDTHFAELDLTFTYVMFEYTSNSISAGTITIDLMGV